MQKKSFTLNWYYETVKNQTHELFLYRFIEFSVL